MVGRHFPGIKRGREREARKKQRQSDYLMRREERRGERKRHFRGKSEQVLPPSLCFVADVGSAFGLPMNFRHDDDLIGATDDGRCHFRQKP